MAYEGGFGTSRCDLGVSLGLPLAYESDFGALGAHFGHTGATLGLLWSPCGVHFGMRGDFGWHLGQLWGHF